MCEVCEKNQDIFSLPSLEVTVNGSYLSINYDAYSSDSSFSEDIRINYCPMCGKQLFDEY